MVIEHKRKADDSALVPSTKKSKTDVATTNKNKSVLQAVIFHNKHSNIVLILYDLRPQHVHPTCFHL